MTMEMDWVGESGDLLVLRLEGGSDDVSYPIPLLS
jgi:hypothetical protein